MWDASLFRRYPVSSLQPLRLFPRPIPALASFGLSPVTLTYHTSLLLLSIWECFAKNLVLQRLAWLLHLQFVQLDAVGDPGRLYQFLPYRPDKFRLRLLREDRRHSTFITFGALFLIHSSTLFTSMNSLWFYRINILPIATV